MISLANTSRKEITTEKTTMERKEIGEMKETGLWLSACCVGLTDDRIFQHNDHNSGSV